MSDGVTSQRPVNSIGRTVVITQLSQPRLDGSDGWIGRRNIGVIYALVIIIGLNVGVITRVVIIRIIIEGVVRIVIPWIKSVIESDPGVAVVDPPVIARIMGMMSIPIAVPILVMARVNVVRSSIQSALRNSARLAGRGSGARGTIRRGR